MSKKKSITSSNTHKLRTPTEGQFVEWLETCRQHLASVTLWPLKATRFTYFESELCWRAPRPDLEEYIAPLVMSDEQTAQDFESDYKAAHENGDPGAIVDHGKAAKSLLALRALLERSRKTHPGQDAGDH